LWKKAVFAQYTEENFKGIFERIQIFEKFSTARRPAVLAEIFCGFHYSL
jgi:hypothetical protein